MKKKRQKPDVYQIVKKVLTKDTIHYPERALYENFLKTNAAFYGKIKDCELLFDPTFGYSVVPKCYNDDYHQGLICNLMDTNTNKRVYMWECGLRHQLYLHDIILKKWKMESEGMSVSIRIDCRPKPYYVTDGF